MPSSVVLLKIVLVAVLAVLAFLFVHEKIPVEEVGGSSAMHYS